MPIIRLNVDDPTYLALAKIANEQGIDFGTLFTDALALYRWMHECSEKGQNINLKKKA
ncbi:MAG TPA: hypothetical protein VK464_08305 [Symbiobacteriaceae bacterium]|jgi:hypothetical protein|nr:hypothetical protein [Symbiobacteriaceae bacterium]